MCFPLRDLRVALRKMCFLSPTCSKHLLIFFAAVCCVCSIVLRSLTRIQSGSGPFSKFTHSLYSPLPWHVLEFKWRCSIFQTAHLAHVTLLWGWKREKRIARWQHKRTIDIPRCGATTEINRIKYMWNFLPWRHQHKHIRDSAENLQSFSSLYRVV